MTPKLKELIRASKEALKAMEDFRDLWVDFGLVEDVEDGPVIADLRKALESYENKKKPKPTPQEAQ